jgi:type IV fimbrial biogenesis protein FimT
MKLQHGLTLIELLVTIVVLTVLLALGVPSFKEFIKNNRLTAQTNNLVVDIQLARSEAVKRGTNTVICASSDQATCTGHATWANGWIVYSDVDLTDGADPVTGGSDPLCEDTEDCIMRTSEGVSGGNSIITDADNIRFLPTGLAANGNVTISVQSRDCYRDQRRDISITLQGHTVVSKADCS